jgi:hypothetical protein
LRENDVQRDHWPCGLEIAAGYAFIGLMENPDRIEARA